MTPLVRANFPLALLLLAWAGNPLLMTLRHLSTGRARDCFGRPPGQD
jgi:hypothetical protein